MLPRIPFLVLFPFGSRECNSVLLIFKYTNYLLLRLLSSTDLSVSQTSMVLKSCYARSGHILVNCFDRQAEPSGGGYHLMSGVSDEIVPFAVQSYYYGMNSEHFILNFI